MVGGHGGALDEPADDGDVRLHVMVAIAEIAGLKSPARAAAMASFSALASPQVVGLGIVGALGLIVL